MFPGKKASFFPSGTGQSFISTCFNQKVTHFQLLKETDRGPFANAEGNLLCDKDVVVVVVFFFFWVYFFYVFFDTPEV